MGLSIVIMINDRVLRGIRGRVGTDTSFYRGAKHAELGEKGVVLAKFINIG